MSASGDGNYYYIESADQLPNIFAMELQGLMAMVGQNVSLGLEMPPEVELLDVFNDFEKLSNGQYQLPNLIAGNIFTVGLRLKIPAQQLDSILTIHLSWDDVEQETRLHMDKTLTLPWVNRQRIEEFPFNTQVQQEVASFLAARAKLEAAEQARRGNYQKADQTLMSALQGITSIDPEAMSMGDEIESLDSLRADLKAGAYQKFSKRGHYQSHMRSRVSLPDDPYLPTDEEIQRTQLQEIKHHIQKVKHRLKLIQGDITQIPVDAMVNGTNPLMTGTSGVDRAIHQGAGTGLRAACATLGTCNPGEAKVTPAFNLPAQWVIHTAGSGWHNGQAQAEKILGNCYRNALKRAVEKGAKSVSFPAIATGALGCPSEWAARIALRTVSKFLAQDPYLDKIIFVCMEDDHYQSYQKLLM